MVRRIIFAISIAVVVASIAIFFPQFVGQQLSLDPEAPAGSPYVRITGLEDKTISMFGGGSGTDSNLRIDGLTVGILRGTDPIIVQFVISNLGDTDAYDLHFQAGGVSLQYCIVSLFGCERSSPFDFDLASGDSIMISLEVLGMRQPVFPVTLQLVNDIRQLVGPDTIRFKGTGPSV